MISIGLELALAYERLAMFSFRRDKYQEAEEMLEKYAYLSSHSCLTSIRLLTACP